MLLFVNLKNEKSALLVDLSFGSSIVLLEQFKGLQI